MKLLTWPHIAAGIITAVCSVALLASVPAFAQSSGGIGGRPANPDPKNTRTQSIFIYTLDKGQTKTDQVLVSNASDEAQTINLYAVDGIVTNTGAYTCEQKSEVSNGVGNWVTLKTKRVTLASRENKKIDFTLKIPATADVGEHNGCLVFQSADDKGEVKGNVRIQTRQAIRMVATVPGVLKRSVAIDQFAVTQKDGLQQFKLAISNKGNVSADVDTTITLKSLFGSRVYKNGGGYPVLSNKQLTVNFVNEKQPFFGGWYRAQASVSYDTNPNQLGVTTGEKLKVVHADDIVVYIAPQPLAMVIYGVVLAIIVAAAVWVLTRRRAHTQAKKTWGTHTVKSGDTIEILATKYGISWKKLAAFNDLKPPYTLTTGATVRVPTPADKSSSDDAKGL